MGVGRLKKLVTLYSERNEISNPFGHPGMRRT